MNVETQHNTNVTATDNALKRVAAIVSGEEGSDAVRISVEGGGCSGFSYKYEIVSDESDDDLVIEGHGGKILIDSMSLIYMNGSQVDFVDDLMGQSFQIKNPNAVASCGCGTSFTI